MTHGGRKVGGALRAKGSNSDWKEAVYKEVHRKTAVQLLLFLEWKMGRQVSKLVTQNIKEKRISLKYTLKDTLGMYP